MLHFQPFSTTLTPTTPLWPSYEYDLKHEWCHKHRSVAASKPGTKLTRKEPDIRSKTSSNATSQLQVNSKPPKNRARDSSNKPFTAEDISSAPKVTTSHTPITPSHRLFLPSQERKEKKPHIPLQKAPTNPLKPSSPPATLHSLHGNIRDWENLALISTHYPSSLIPPIPPHPTPP